MSGCGLKWARISSRAMAWRRFGSLWPTTRQPTSRNSKPRGASKMANAKVTVAFDVEIRHDSNGGHGYFSDSLLSAIEYGSDAMIKNKLRKRAEAEVAE